MRKLAAALVLLLAAGAAGAQGGQKFVLHQEVAKADRLADYEATSKEFVALVKAHKAKMPHFSFTGLMSPDLTYTFVAPIANMAALDAINAEFGALAQAAGPAFGELMRRGGDATEYTKEWIVEHVPELSYVPAQPRFKPEEARYFHYTFYYVKSAREAEADAIGADYVKLFKAKGSVLGYNVYRAVLGGETPLYVVGVPARDAAEFQIEDAKNQALLGAEGKALGARALALTRRLEMRDAVLRPDLTVPAQ